jgi:hypothetical protein
MSCRYLDPLLGGGYKPDCTTRWKKWIVEDGSERLVFDVQFTTDHWGHRIVPRSASVKPANQALFFGCSYTVGAALNDDETLPAYFARSAPDFAVYNFAASGFGPQQMLAALTETDMEPVQPSTGRTVAIYVFLHFHVERAAGTYSVAQSFGKYFPYYHFGSDGRLIHSGNFTSGRPWRTRVYDLIAESGVSFLDALMLSASKEPSRADARLTAAIIRASADAFRARYHSDEFYVLSYPDTAAIEPAVIEAIAATGVRFLDYSHLVDMYADGERLPLDGHPAPMANQAVASRLADDLHVAVAAASADE